MSVANLFEHAVTGFRVGGNGRYPRSRMEMGLGLSLSLLVALLAKDIWLLMLGAIAVATLVCGFYLFAFIRALRLEAAKGDQAYNKEGKYKLSKEYRETDSANAARKRNRG